MIFQTTLQLNFLLQSFHAELPNHVSNVISTPFLNYCGYLTIAKQNRGKDPLIAQQQEMNSFADYLLARYLVAQGQIARLSI